MSNAPKISVIIPVYKVEQYLRRCLDSVINQTYRNLEIICINDGSPDNSLAILEEYAAKDDRVIVINQENSGVSAARNAGLDKATGEYIAFVDADDYMVLENLELAVNRALVNKNAGLIYWGVDAVCYEDYQVKNYRWLKSWYSYFARGRKNLSEHLVNRMVLAPWGKLYKTSIIKDNKIFFNTNYKLAEDVLFNIQYLSYVDEVYFIPQNLYVYILRANSAMERLFYNEPDYVVQNYIELYKEVYNHFEQKHLLEKFFKFFSMSMLNRILYNFNINLRSKKIFYLNCLRDFFNEIDDSFNTYENFEHIKNSRFYKIPQLRIPYIDKGTSCLGLELYRHENPKLVIKILGLKVSIHYQKLFSVKNEKNHKKFSILGLRFKISKKKKFVQRVKSIMRGIFSVHNEYKRNIKYKIIRLAGFKIKHRVNFDKAIARFVAKNNQYLNRSDKSIIRRLFFTTGSISLVNNLVAIRQLKSKNCEDTVLILSNLPNDKFFEVNKKVAQQHNFKEIYTICTWGVDVIEFCLKNKLTDFDEIYFSNQYQFISTVNTLYPNTKWIVTDEGCGGKMARIGYLDYNKVDKIVTHPYLGKLDFFGLSERNLRKIVPLDLNIFRNVADACSKLYPVELNLSERDKAVIFCGSWWEISGLSRDEYIAWQDEILNKLIALGYKVLFKPHPRDTRKYIDNPNIQMFETVLPMECYDIDVVAIVSLSSSASLHSMYFRDIPGFSLALEDKNDAPLNLKWLDGLFKRIVSEYTTPISELFVIDPQMYSKDELVEILRQKCLNYINSKSMLSQNKYLKSYAADNGYLGEEGEIEYVTNN